VGTEEDLRRSLHDLPFRLCTDVGAVLYPSTTGEPGHSIKYWDQSLIRDASNAMRSFNTPPFHRRPHPCRNALDDHRLHVLRQRYSQAELLGRLALLAALLTT
jgi:hypothetical protein